MTDLRWQQKCSLEEVYVTHPRVYVGESEVDNFRFVYITDSRSLFMMLLVFDDSLKM